MNKSIDEKMQFRIELAMALVITGLACAAGFSNLLLASNETYPVSSVDALGHLAKVYYIAQCIKDGILPAWFPYWYCGTSVTQYYPPLSYYVMVPIQMLTQNIMLTFKINCYIMIFAGGMGVWYFARLYLGKWCGLFGTVVFCLQPFILETLLGQGQVAQGPVIALTPWYFIALLSFGKKPAAGKFAIITVMCLLMILSHPNSAFMYSICIMTALAFFLPMRLITFHSYTYICISILFAGLLSAFWSLVGVTELENPGIPSLLGEAVMLSTATIDWFLEPTNFFYFGISVSIACIAAILMFAYNVSLKKISKHESYYILFIVFTTVFSTVFSFGLRLPLFEYLPLAESFVPGRILNLTSVSAAILCAYLVSGIQSLSRNKKAVTKIFTFIVCLSVMGSVIFFINPFKTGYYVRNDEAFHEMISKVDADGKSFKKGRYTFIGPFDCSQTYFPIQYGFNISEGYNIEGTPHNKVIWNQITANTSENFDYLAKSLAFWNVRYLLLDKRYDQVEGELNKKYTFQAMNEIDGNKFYASDNPSSYFLMDHRNALVFGPGSPGVAIEFPYLVWEYRSNILDYSLEELEKYKLIYICEPVLDTIQEKQALEKMVGKLVDNGVKVIIEPVTTKGYPLFNVTVADMPAEKSPFIQKNNKSEIKSSIEKIQVEKELTYYRVLLGLDKSYYKLIQNNGRLENDVIGIKKVGNGEVVFVGMHLSQYLKAVYTRNRGASENEAYPGYCYDVETLFEDIFKTYGVNAEFWPEPFPVVRSDWNYKGVDFTYSSQKSQVLTLSVTYTPRWKASIDGTSIPVGQRENLITLNLPPGEHRVTLVYGLTKYGIAGYIISLAGLLLLLLFLRFYDIIFNIITKCCGLLRNYLQI